MTAIAVAPAPAWNVIPSRTAPSASIAARQRSAIARPAPDGRAAVVPDAIPAGSPGSPMTSASTRSAGMHRRDSARRSAAKAITWAACAASVMA